MKKRLILIIVLLTCLFASAQEGEIIYIDFEPDLTRDYREPGGDWTNPPSLFIDIDQDGTDDIKFTANVGWGHFMELVLSSLTWPWEFRLPYLLYDEDPAVPILGDSIQFGDTIAHITESWAYGYRFKCYNHNNEPHPFVSPNNHYYISIRKKVEERYCYGWVDANIIITDDELQHVLLTIFRLAYCTIPDYPLWVGQTSLDWGLEDTEATVFATIHPNPTTGLVIITGKALKQAEVLNTLGQHVAIAQGKGETLQIDIANLPTGIYFVRVMDEEGRKCIRKVVKE